MKAQRQIGMAGRAEAGVCKFNSIRGPRGPAFNPETAFHFAKGRLRLAGNAAGLFYALLVFAVIMSAAQIALGQVTIGENTKLDANGSFTFGYEGAYGDNIESSHGLFLGGSGNLSGYYYNPNFINFTAMPFYNQSRSDSDSQSLTDSTGVNGAVNFFTGSHFPGSVNYYYDRNSSGTFGLAGQPNFTTIGNSHGFSIGWSALVPDWPTLSVSYAQGDGSGTIYGTDQETSSATKLFNVHSSYRLAGFPINAFYTHNTMNSEYPEFLTGEGNSQQDSTGQSMGVGTSHALPMQGTFYANFTRTSNTGGLHESGQLIDQNSYTDDIEDAGASFHPTQKLNFYVNENYTSNLSGYVSQSLGTNNVVPVDLGSGAHSYTFGGGAGYQLTHWLNASAVATHYDQYYFGQSYTGTFVSGSLNTSRRLFNMFSFAASVVDSSNAENQNVIGFITTVNYSHRIGGWNTSASFTYAQNAQTMLVTYTTSYYNYSANARRRLIGRWYWTAAFNGAHSGIPQAANSSNHSESYSASLSSPRLTFTGGYSQSSGFSVLGAGGLVGVAPTPGIVDSIQFTGDSYNGGISVTPISRMSIAGTYSRGISNTYGQTLSHNDTQIFNAQLQYHLRRIGLQAGWTRYTQGISSFGLPATTTSYYVGFNRWLNFF
jgi:hypothetical protein